MLTKTTKLGMNGTLVSSLDSHVRMLAYAASDWWIHSVMSFLSIVRVSRTEASLEEFEVQTSV